MSSCLLRPNPRSWTTSRHICRPWRHEGGLPSLWRYISADSWAATELQQQQRQQQQQQQQQQTKRSEETSPSLRPQPRTPASSPAPILPQRSLVRRHASKSHGTSKVGRQGANVWRAVFVNGLDPSTTISDVLQAIIKHGPFGMVLSIKRLYNSRGQHGANVEFNCQSAADQLIHAVRQDRFFVNGKKPFVMRDRLTLYYEEYSHLSVSRVLRLTGKPNVEGFNEEGMRAVLKQDPDLVNFIKTTSAANNWGFGSEPAQETLAPDGRSWKIIDWPFYSNAYQAKPFMAVLRKHFGSQLEIAFGEDPCAAPSQVSDIPLLESTEHGESDW